MSLRSVSGALRSIRALCLVCFALLIAFSFSHCSSEPDAPPAPKVAVMKVLQKDVPIYGEFVGQTIGSVDIDIRARVDGQLEGLHFTEGRPVNKGDLLYTIDPQPFEASVVAVQGEVDEAMTQLQKAEADLARVEPLAKINAVSQRDLDAAVAARDAALASVDTAKAKLEYANIELGYTRIQAPVSGMIGITAARVGDYVGKEPNPVVLNVLSQIDPIHVRVTFSEREYLAFARRHIEETGTTLKDKEADKKAEFKLVLSDGSTHKHTGKLFAINSQVDPTTGTLTLEASFPNPSALVRPGQYAKLRFVERVEEDAMLVWQRAVQELQSIFQVYTVDSENKVQLKQVKVGEKSDGIWVIEEGLTPDDRVIVEGMQKVRPGMVVKAMTPEELEVTPPNSALLADESATDPSDKSEGTA